MMESWDFPIPIPCSGTNFKFKIPSFGPRHRGRKDEKIYNNQTPIEQNRRGETAFWPFKVLKIDPDFENGRKIPYGVVVVGYIFERADTEHGLKEYRIRPIGQCREINNGQVSPR